MFGHIPLFYKLGCLMLTALVVWGVSVCRDPRGWRRLYQVTFLPTKPISINRNKVMDESLKKWAILATTFLILADLACMTMGVAVASQTARRLQLEASAPRE